VVLFNSAAGLRRGLTTITDLGPFSVETSLYIERIRNFLSKETAIVSAKKKELTNQPSILECRNVSFGYNSSGMILQNVNLIIHPGEKIALVGYNGAGKTTLIKLILRLYEPSEGAILLNGNDIRDYDLAEYRNHIGVVFQDFQVYATSIEQNVVMDVKPPSGEEKVIEAIKKGGFYEKLQALPNGLNTEITNEFDDGGTELSGGEEQKLVVARSFYKEAGMVLLDEPSSALDPLAEYELNCAMNKMAEQRSVIFISHRLSTTRHADRIYVMKDGCIIEEGTHDALLRNDGVYRAMWNAQALKYAN
jgi:ATP-binding cassette subfamily B protein